jgi:hypothetical protein
MAFISISGEPGCRHEELARITTQRLHCELVTDSRLVDTIAAEFGDTNGIPEKAWPHLALSILAKLGVQHHIVTSSAGSELPDRDVGGAQGVWPPERRGVRQSCSDFYRIAWDYEPRSFPLQWDKDGKVSEAFTPDFYLPEFDLYVELTTMKQANVTRKNRKIRLLRAIYPHVNIQVFYQKDVQDLVMKYGLPERLAR